MTYMNDSGGILVIGESLVDVVVPRRGPSRRHAGGSPMNVAVGVARLGSHASLVTSFSDDADGAIIADHLARSRVTACVQATTNRTSTAVATIGPDGSATYEFDIVWSIENKAPFEHHIAHTGSIATLLAPGADVVHRMIELRRPESLITFDPNVRLGLARNTEDVRSAFDRFADLADVVKMSDEDAEAIFGEASDDEIIAETLLRGPSLAIVTKGEEGALFGTRAGNWHTLVPPISAPVADTVGAGDSFMAGLLRGIDVSLASGALSIEEIRRSKEWSSRLVDPLIDLAISCAAVTVSRAGADLPTASDVDIDQLRKLTTERS